MAATELDLARSSDKTLRLALKGTWRLRDGRLPEPAEALRELERPPRPERVVLDAVALEGWDSGLLTYLVPLQARCLALGVELDASGLPQGARRLLALATAVPARAGHPTAEVAPFLQRVGERAERRWSGTVETFTFIGEASLALFRALRGRARFRRSDFLLVVQDCGARSLPIVALISMLVGLILAFVGAIQLRLFGAQIYVADLVGIAVVREIGAIMTGVIVTGRTGASFAAELGTMQVNEEIDALRTLGIPPVDFLVLPRVLALTLMMPLLCLYADVMGITGGLLVGVGMLDLNPMQYLLETQRALHLNDLLLGLFMSTVFGVLIGVTGCMRGLTCGRSAAAVGGATTSAVVTGIVSIVVATAVITVIAYVLGI